MIGRGRLIADTTVRELLAAASGDRVVLRTSMRSEAMTVLANAGATVAANDREALTVSGLPAERIAAVLSEARLPFSELAAHRASLEEAYMELTRDAVQFARPPGAGGVMAGRFAWPGSTWDRSLWWCSPCWR